MEWKVLSDRHTIAQEDRYKQAQHKWCKMRKDKREHQMPHEKWSNLK